MYATDAVRSIFYPCIRAKLCLECDALRVVGREFVKLCVESLLEEVVDRRFEGILAGLILGRVIHVESVGLVGSPRGVAWGVWRDLY